MIASKFKYMAAGAMCLALGACETYPVRTDANAKLSVTRCHSFGWLEAQRDQRRVGAFDNPINDQRLRDAVASSLAARGVQPVAAGAMPDCLVGHAIGARNVVNDDYAPFSWGFGYGFGRRNMFGSLAWSNDAYAYREGRISVDVFDAGSREPLWHGSVQLDVTSLTGASAQQRIDAAVKAMFAKYPAGGPST